MNPSARGLVAGLVLSAPFWLGLGVVGKAIAGDRPDSHQGREHVPMTVATRQGEQLRRVLFTDRRNRVEAIRVCKRRHHDDQHCFRIPVAWARYGAGS